MLLVILNKIILAGGIYMNYKYEFEAEVESIYVLLHISDVVLV